MKITNKKIEHLSRALLPKYGLHDVPSLVATIKKYRDNDGHVSISRPEGIWSWLRSSKATSVTPSRITLGFRADYRRDAAHAREDLYRQLEDATLAVMSEEEMEDAIAGPTKKRKKAASPAAPSARAQPSVKKTPAQLDREIAEVLSASQPPRVNLGMARAERLAEKLRALGHEAEAYRWYGKHNAVGVHRTGPMTTGTWRQAVLFTDEGDLVPPAGGRHFGTGNPWRYGPEHDAVEEVLAWQP